MEKELLQQLRVLTLQMQQLAAQMSKMPELISLSLENRQNRLRAENIQKEYSYKSLLCTSKPPVFIEGSENMKSTPGTLFLYVAKPFILLGTQTVSQKQVGVGQYGFLDIDSDLVPGRTIYNHHMFLPDHPFIYLASYADCTQAITAPGLYTVPDYRSNVNDVDMEKERQIAFLLVCNNYTQGGGI